MSNLFFSVVIPLYQKEHYIARALDSVLRQTYPHFEIVVVDDGSSDCSPEIVEGYTDKRVKLFRQKNSGVSVARNKGIELSEAQYIALLDADDEWESDFLFEMNRLINLYPDCGWYSCKRTTLYTNGKIKYSSSELSEGVIFNYFEIANNNDIVHSSSIVVPKKIFETVGGFDISIRTGEEDVVMWTKIAGAFKVCYTPKVLSRYYFYEVNMEKRLMVREPDHYYEMMEKGNFWKNEYLADLALHRGILESIYGSRLTANQIEVRYGFTQLHRAEMKRLRIYNRVPQKFLYWSFKGLKSLILFKRNLFNRNPQ